MADEPRSEQPNTEEKAQVAVACQGGGIHASFAVGVLTEILDDLQKQNRFKLIGLSGTSAGALCTLIAWYGLASKSGQAGSPRAAIEQLNDFWDRFAATTGAEVILNTLAYAAFRAREQEVLGVNAPIFSLNPRAVISRAITAALPALGVRRRYFDLDKLLREACPQFDAIEWDKLKTRLLVGASEVVNGIETIFDSDRNMTNQGNQHCEPVRVTERWRERLPLSLDGVAASGTLPEFLQPRKIEGSYYWDGLYSQNPPIREFLAGVRRQYVPDEIWVVRINPQQCAAHPKSNAQIQDRENELMGNLSLNKELDFIYKVNKLRLLGDATAIAQKYKEVKVRTIMMRRQTATELRYSSKFDRSRDFMDQLRTEGRTVGRQWLGQWPTVGEWPADAAYWPRPRFY